jgi:single-strand DNA-binding protein
MNNWSITGNLGRDAEVRTTNNSTVCDFSVAVKSGYGEYERTVWVKCSLWGKQAESALPGFLLKGQLVGVTGEVTADRWTKDGQEHPGLELRVSSVDLLGKRSEDQPAPAPAQRQAPAPQPVPQTASAAPETPFLEDDLPF